MYEFDQSGCEFSPLDGDVLVKFANSLVGKDFQAVLQTVIFVVAGTVSSEQLELWKALAVLGQLVWTQEIKDSTQYVKDLEIAITNFMDRTALLTPQWFNKKKWHISLHLIKHVRRFGPPVNFATEKFESYNGVMREQSVYSNRHAPSRDIARSLVQSRSPSPFWWLVDQLCRGLCAGWSCCLSALCSE